MSELNTKTSPLFILLPLAKALPIIIEYIPTFNRNPNKAQEIPKPHAEKGIMNPQTAIG